MRDMFTPKYQITDSILNKLTEISEIKAMVEKSRLLPARESFLRKTAIIKMAHTSTSIEGNTLDEYQVEKLVQGKNVSADKNQIKEVKNYLSALKKIDALGEKKEFSIEDILDVHRIVVSSLVEPKKIGRFRSGPVYIVNVESDGNEELAYTPPKAKQVAKLMDDLISWLNAADKIHPAIRAGLFHYQFVTIHPFTDGNGRVARLFTLLHLYQSEWDFKRALVLEDYYNTDRKKYYTELQTGKDYDDRQGIDLTSWLEYFIEGFLYEAEKLKDSVLVLQAVKTDSIKPQVLDRDELKVLDFVTTVGSITSSDVSDILEIPKRTAQEKLRKLVDKGVLLRVGKGPASSYEIAKPS